MNINIKTFDNWASLRKDIMMEEGHKKSVNKIIDIIYHDTQIFTKKFSFLDLGCGNGWVIRKIIQNSKCINATGIDGSYNMIRIAKSYKIGNFFQQNIEDSAFDKKYDVIFSMETLYYIKNIKDLLVNIYKNGLNKNGILIIGIDHYKENTSTLNWDAEYNLSTNTQSISKWIGYFKNSGFSKVNYLLYGKRKNWNGTLIIYALKN